MLNKCVCIHCLKDVVNPRFLIPAHFEALNANHFECSPDIIGLDNQKTDSIMKTKLNYYGIAIPEDEPARLSCDASEKTLQLKSGLKIIVKPVEKLKAEFPDSIPEIENAATIDGKALFIYQPFKPMTATELVCDSCHLILSSRNVVRTTDGTETVWESVDDTHESNFTVSLIAGSKAGKTNLLLAMRKPENRVHLKLMTEEPFIENHFTMAEDALNEGHVPETTLSPQPPITFRTDKNQDINIIDTRGEETKEIRIDRAVWSDMLIVLLDIASVFEHDEGQEKASGLKRLKQYLGDLERHCRTRSEKKPIILCFTKCDLYPDTADDIMLYPLKDNAENYDPAKLRVIRNYHFMDNIETMIHALCTELSSKIQNKDSQIYRAIYRTVQDIIAYCNQISGQKVDIMCIAPLGTPAENGRINAELYKPQHVDSLLHRIVQYASEA
ncbi:MAG: GTPase domain-containing protein [Oscillospiraceae bacterium]|nr:GTPase domain-containing protein [Oscillospiraceae bacterium]